MSVLPLPLLPGIFERDHSLSSSIQFADERSKDAVKSQDEILFINEGGGSTAGVHCRCSCSTVKCIVKGWPLRLLLYLHDQVIHVAQELLATAWQAPEYLWLPHSDPLSEGGKLHREGASEALVRRDLQMPQWLPRTLQGIEAQKRTRLVRQTGLAWFFLVLSAACALKFLARMCWRCQPHTLIRLANSWERMRQGRSSCPPGSLPGSERRVQ